MYHLPLKNLAHIPTFLNNLQRTGRNISLDLM